MLILSRRRDEAIVIGGEIRVTVLKTQGDSVRLGIEAPPHVTVHRDEVHQRILAELQGPTASESSVDSRQDAA